MDNIPDNKIQIQISPGANLESWFGSFETAKGKKVMQIRKKTIGLIMFEDFLE